VVDEIIIRKYQGKDRSTIRKIAWDTAFMGDCGDAFFSGAEVLKDFLTLYFTDYEPESCFVAEATDRVVGYLMGTKNTEVLEKIFSSQILLPLIKRSFQEGIFLKKKNLAFIFHSLISLLRGEFRMPDISREYPATLHINIQKDFRRLNIGSRLISVYLAYLKEEKVGGVYLCTLSDSAAEFFQKQGFNLIYQGRRSYFRYILKHDLSAYIYGRRLI
jgi:GNAT superfamily N-acetyltransferase